MTGRVRRPTWVGGADRLDGFLATAMVSVLDVRRGAAAGTRRLLLGEPGNDVATYVVSVADRPDVATGVETEIMVLDELRSTAAPSILPTLPEVVATTTVAGRPAVVLTASEGLRVGASDGPMPADALDSVRSWLAELWRGTGGVAEPVELGRAAADRLLARACGSRRLGPTLGAVHRARRRLEAHRVSRTAVHGCLCARHAPVHAGGVTGVDDWSIATLRGEPLRDLGGYAVRHVGERLPEVVADRSARAHLVRDFVVAGLAAFGLPGSDWRDVLVLAQLERAVAGLEHGQVDQMGLLAATVQALPREHEESEAVR